MGDGEEGWGGLRARRGNRVWEVKEGIYGRVSMAHRGKVLRL